MVSGSEGAGELIGGPGGGGAERECGVDTECSRWVWSQCSLLARRVGEVVDATVDVGVGALEGVGIDWYGVGDRPVQPWKRGRALRRRCRRRR